MNRGIIVSKKAILKHAIRYFTEWKYQRVSVMNKFNMSRKETDKFFMANQTFENRLQCIEGFVAYIDEILGLENGNNASCIPGLHSNQSSLENYFQE